MTDTVPSTCRFFMPHPETGVMVPVTRSTMSFMPLTTFLKQSYYRLDDGRFIRSLTAAGGDDRSYREQFHRHLLEQLI